MDGDIKIKINNNKNKYFRFKKKIIKKIPKSRGASIPRPSTHKPEAHALCYPSCLAEPGSGIVFVVENGEEC